MLIAESAAVIAAAGTPQVGATLCAIVKPRKNVAVWSMGEIEATARYQDLGDRIRWNGGPTPQLVRNLVKNGSGPEARFACRKV